MSGRTYFVYILANKKKGTLYIGVTNNLLRRVFLTLVTKLQLGNAYTLHYYSLLIAFFKHYP